MNTRDVIRGNCLKILAHIMDGKDSRVRSLMRMMGMKHLNAVHCHLRRLKKLGLIVWEPTLARTIVPTVRFIPAEELP